MANNSDYLYNRYHKLAWSSVEGGAVRRYGVAVFGLGRAGIIHISNILATPRLRLSYLVDNNTQRLATVKRNFCLSDDVVCLSPTQLDTIYNDDKVDAVLVATPTNDHEQYVKASIMAGKHVLCEKPIALHIENIKACYQLAHEKKKTLLCAFNRRFDPSISELVTEVRSGNIGQVHSIHSVARDCPKPSMDYLKISGGLCHDCIVHDIDLICNFIMEEAPVKVFGVAHAFDHNIGAISDYDTVSVTLKFPSGALGSISISREAVYGYDQRVEVFGSKGLLRSENQRPNALIKSTKEGCTMDPIMYSFPSRYKEAYIRQLEHFLSVMDGTEKLLITSEQVIMSSKIVEALEHSIKTEAFVKIQYD